MTLTYLWLPALSAAALTAWLIWILRPWLLHWGLVDQPDPRRLNKQATVRGGGLAMALVLLVLAAVWIMLMQVATLWSWSMMVLLIGLAVLGGLEDRYGLGVMTRLIVQAALAVLALALMLGSVAPLSPVLWVLAVFCFLWCINLHNFMDGLDGLAGLQGLWVGGCFAALFWAQGDSVAASWAALLAGTSAGFLLWNWPPAKLFMGDSGSLMLGGLVSGLLAWGHFSAQLPLWQGLMCISVFVVDASLTLLWRVVKGQRWYTPHRSHAYQLLVSMGVSQKSVVLGFVALNLALVLPLMLLARSGHWPPVVAGLILLGVLAGLWGTIQALARSQQQDV